MVFGIIILIFLCFTLRSHLQRQNLVNYENYLRDLELKLMQERIINQLTAAFRHSASSSTGHHSSAFPYNGYNPDYNYDIDGQCSAVTPERRPVANQRRLN